MSKNVRNIGLPISISDLLIKNKLTSCKDVLNKSSMELMFLIKISIQSANEIIFKASKASAPSVTNALKMKNEIIAHKKYLKTTLGILDNLLSGGLRKGSITEIAGPPGCGKTQLCMMLAIVAITLDDTKTKSVLYIDTEGAFDANRLCEIARHKYPVKYHNLENLQSLANRIFVYRELNFKDLTRRLNNLEEEIITHRAGLVIIDSIACPTRREFNSSNVKSIYDRNKSLSKQASLLKFLSSEYDFPVVVTNHITTQFGGNNAIFKGKDLKSSEECDEDGFLPSGDGGSVVALGVHWNHCVNARIILQYSTTSPELRELHLVKSPQAPYVKLIYAVESSGIVIKSHQSEGGYYQLNNVPDKMNIKSGILL